MNEEHLIGESGLTNPTFQKEYEAHRTVINTLLSVGMMEFHCRRHYYIRNFGEFDTASQNEIVRAIVYFNGQKSYWYNKKVGLEFFNNTKVYPQATKPWGWCGTSVLFADWKEREEANRELGSNFHIGEEVEFEYKNRVYRGLISAKNKRATIIIKGDTSKYYMPFSFLKKV